MNVNIESILMKSLTLYSSEFLFNALTMPEDNITLIDIKPVLCGYILEAQQMLGPGVPDEKMIHDVRVLMKKSRAAIKLLKTQTDEVSFNREYSAFREVGRIMSDMAREFSTP